MPVFHDQDGVRDSRGGGSESQVREWLDADGCFRFGKHEGARLEDIAEDDPNYLEWVVESAESISEEERGIVRGAVEFAESRHGSRRRR